jgi:hypothetical protein
MSELPIQTPPRAGTHAADEIDFQNGFHAGSTAPGTVDLSADPFADDLNAELAAAAPKQWRNRATLVLGALALLVGGFLGGVLTEKHFGASATTNARNNAINQFLNGGGFAGRRGAGGGASTAPTPSASASATVQTNSGTIKLVDGTTIYVGLASGDVLTVQTTTATKISVGSATKVSQLKAGQSVTVTGPTDANGDVTATSITSGP